MLSALTRNTQVPKHPTPPPTPMLSCVVAVGCLAALQEPSGQIFSLLPVDDWRDVRADLPKGFDDIKQIACGGGVVVLITADALNLVRWNVKEGSSRCTRLLADLLACAPN